VPFLHSLNILVKYVRLYGFDRRRTRAQFQMAWNVLRAAVPKRHGSVVLGVSDDKLLVDGVPVETGHAERGFAQLLTAAGVGSIQFASEVSEEEFEDFVRAFSFSSARAQDFAAHIRHAFPEDKGTIRINQVKFIAADRASADLSAAAQLAAQSLSPEIKQWLSEPEKLVQLIAAAEGAQRSTGYAPNEDQLSFDLGIGSEDEASGNVAPSVASDTPFPLNEKETIDALRLLTRAGLTSRISGDGFVVDQKPEPGADLGRVDLCELTLGRRPAVIAGGSRP